MKKKTVIGFTGARDGMTHAQISTMIKLLMRIYAKTMCMSKGEHGDCVGADADFDALCRGLGIPTECRPCTLESLRAHTPAVQLAEPVAPMQRNRDVVADSDLLLACPPNFKRIARGSGTWATIGFAEEKGIDVHVVYPDGTIHYSEGNGKWSSI